MKFFYKKMLKILQGSALRVDPYASKILIATREKLF